MTSSKKISVAILGATGTVGQRFIALLAAHPWFEVAAITASPRSEGKSYSAATSWIQGSPIPPRVREMVLQPTVPGAVAGCPLVFSALDAKAADSLEEPFAQAGHLVVTNARSHRMDRDVPLMVGEVNADHLDLLDAQRWPGGIIANPNCSTIGLVLALKPLVEAFGVRRLNVVTMQAISGAGLPGISSYQILDNLIPLIPGEEDKLETEPRKILGRLAGDHIAPYPIEVSAHCNRVPVIDGHTLCVSVELEKKVSEDQIHTAWREFRSQAQRLRLPSAPTTPIHVLDGSDHPQPRLHRDLGEGMAASVGRLRPCPILDYKFVTLSHNTVRGAAGGALLLAELAAAQGKIPGVSAMVGS